MKNQRSTPSQPQSASIIFLSQGTIFSFMAQVALGAIFVALLSQWEIPLEPVPITMHTFGIFLLSTALGAECSFASLVFYLLMATMGLPVLSGTASNPLWLLSPSGGFLLSFPLVALWLGKMLEKEKTFSILMLFWLFSLAQCLIWLFGSVWLGFFIGAEHAFAAGVYPFIPGAVIKILLAVSVVVLVRKINSVVSSKKIMQKKL